MNTEDPINAFINKLYSAAIVPAVAKLTTRANYVLTSDYRVPMVVNRRSV